MRRDTSNRFDPTRLPEGTVIGVVLLVILAVGVLLVVHGLL